ncbi:MAG: family 10 glycosylhydrolase [Ignavibacteriaceae bacterium]|nr:family 10 glycosylhydrolase [Ignavibacteriaceae bacterium]
MRGAWIATITNIDWPSSRNLSSWEQKEELISILDKLKASGINTVFFQVRTECDAFYKSNYEPWSIFLTGRQGTPPSPFYDPLEFAIDQAHKRGLELHAWLNPLRVSRNGNLNEACSDHISNRNPDWILYFTNYCMLNPGIPEVRNYIAEIVSDIVSRYDVDGITFDDYFYPYSPTIKYEDVSDFKKYGNDFTHIQDWRRNNINKLIEKVNSSIKSVKPYVKFGISPFGIVENKFAGTRGLNSYSEIYCDPLNWLKNRTIDYVIPQLYWEIGKPTADYSRLLPWWASVIQERHLYIGHYSTKMTSYNYFGKSSELGDQVRMNRKLDNVLGSVFFSASSIVKNTRSFSDTLKQKLFRYPAIVPVMEWIDSVPPLPPVKVNAEATYSGNKIQWSSPGIASDGEKPNQFVIYRFNSNSKIDLSNPAAIIGIVDGKTNYFIDNSLFSSSDITYVVSSLDRLKNESLNNPSCSIFYRNQKHTMK